MQTKTIFMGAAGLLTLLIIRVMLADKPQQAGNAPALPAQEPFPEDGQPLPVRSAVWDTLGLVTYDFIPDSMKLKAVFPEAVLRLDQQEVSLAGYMYPLSQDREQTHFMLSALPINAGFFCGVGGPETVVEVRATHPVKLLSTVVHMRGRLQLQHSGSDMLYLLSEAIPVTQ